MEARYKNVVGSILTKIQRLNFYLDDHYEENGNIMLEETLSGGYI